MVSINKDNESQNIIHLMDLIKISQSKIRNNDSDLIDSLLNMYLQSVQKNKDKERESYQITLNYINEQRDVLNKLESIIKERI